YWLRTTAPAEIVGPLGGSHERVFFNRERATACVAPRHHTYTNTDRWRHRTVGLMHPDEPDRSASDKVRDSARLNSLSGAGRSCRPQRAMDDRDKGVRRFPRRNPRGWMKSSAAEILWAGRACNSGLLSAGLAPPSESKDQKSDHTPA